MQKIVQVLCKKGKSIRDAIATDPELIVHSFEVIREKKLGRSPGWLKIKSITKGRQGSLNVQWASTTNILTCRIVNKGRGSPNLVIGDFVNYLMERYSKRITVITVVPG